MWRSPWWWWWQVALKIRLEVENAIFNGITRGGRRGFWAPPNTPPCNWAAQGGPRDAQWRAQHAHPSPVASKRNTNELFTFYSHTVPNEHPSLARRGLESAPCCLAAHCSCAPWHWLPLDSPCPPLCSFVPRGEGVFSCVDTEAHRGTQRKTALPWGTTGQHAAQQRQHHRGCCAEHAGVVRGGALCHGRVSFYHKIIKSLKTNDLLVWMDDSQDIQLESLLKCDNLKCFWCSLSVIKQKNQKNQKTNKIFLWETNFRIGQVVRWMYGYPPGIWGYFMFRWIRI